MRETIWTRKLKYVRLNGQPGRGEPGVEKTYVLSLYGLLCISIRPRYPTTSELEPRIIAVMKVQVLYFQPRKRWPTSERPKIPMKMMLAAMLGAYPRDEPLAGQPGPIILHFMSAMMTF